MSKTAQLEKHLAEAQSRLTKIAIQLAELKAEAVQAEWPQKGGEYLVVSTLNRGAVNTADWDGDSGDNYRLATGNVHRTKEDAEAYRDWLTDPRTQARRRVEMCEGFDLASKVEVYVDDGGLMHVSELVSAQYYGGLRFTTEERANACIDELGEDVIKRALGVTC